MSTNSMLSYSGHAPNQGLLGYQPRELYDPEVKTISAAAGALETAPDAIEVAIRLRMMAKEAIPQSFVEDRLAVAQNTKMQKFKLEGRAKIIDGAKADLWREPDSKDDPGWRGPCEVIKVYQDGSKAVVDWRGHIMLVPIRHLHPHVGFEWLLQQKSHGGRALSLIHISEPTRPEPI
eukprot:4846311-Pyramimonas_sp.AAC.1